MSAATGHVVEFALRLAGPADLPGIMAVERTSFAAPWTERMFAEELGRDYSHVWVAERSADRRVCGFVVFWLAVGEVHLLNLAVEPGSRRRGIARAMVAALVALATDRGADHILLEVRPSNAAAIRVYQSFGFRPVGIRPRYYADSGEDAVIMVKPIGA